MRQRKFRNKKLLGSALPITELTKSEINIVSVEVFSAAQAAIEE